MSASLAPGRVTKDDIKEFDLESRPIDRRGRTIYSERFIHSEIYKARADVRAILHSHSPTVIPFGAANDAKVGKALAATLGNRTVALMRGRGNVVVGPNIRRMVSRAIYTEVNARLQLQALALGSQIIYLDETEARVGENNRDRSGQPGTLKRRNKRRPDRHFAHKIEAWAVRHSSMAPEVAPGFWKRSFFSNI